MSDEINEVKENSSKEIAPKSIKADNNLKENEPIKVRKSKRPALVLKKAAMQKNKKLDAWGLKSGAAALRLSNKENPEIVEKARRKTKNYTEGLRPMITEMIASGIKSPRQIGLELNKRQVFTVKNKKWQPSTVQKLLKKLDINSQ